MDFKGLTSAEVEQSRKENGSNKLTETKGESFWDKLKGNFDDPMIKILIVALLVNVGIFILGKTGVVAESVEWYEPLGIAVAVILATFVSTISEYNNENAFQKLQDEASRILCKVYRDGAIVEIPIDDIVAGDYILLQSGDKIPADGIIADGTIKVDQSVLNGESKEATKKVMPEGYVEDEEKALDTLNEYKVFRGTIVCSGNAVMIAKTVGDKSEYGKIAAELQQDDERDSPLKVKLADLANGISKFGYIGGIAIAVALLFSRLFLEFDGGVTAFFARESSVFVPELITNILDAIILAVIIIVMAVPEGLPLMIAIVSAQNMGKMLKDNVLVRKINGIETAGSLNILFSDKTGTITKGQLEVVSFVDGYGTEYKSVDETEGRLKDLLTMSIIDNSTSVVNEGRAIGGNATERAVLTFAIGSKTPEGVEKLANIPFNSDNKYSATTVSVNGEKLTLIKGAPEKIVERCKFFYDSKGEKVPVSGNWVIDDKMNEMAGRAIRVLALAVSDKTIDKDSDKLPNGEWTLVGILGIRDEVRPESITAIKEVHSAGVQVVMITGDRKDTACAIAKEAGIIDIDDAVTLTSDELSKLSDDEIKKILPRLRVISRALPSDKSRLVRIAQELDLVAGMTGDGVNDSPALKKADVGFAMGGGTEVAKEASDIVILDDNFNSIDKAILYGRTIFNSIRKFIIFQLTINVAAVAVSFICPLLGMDNPLSIIQILWVNLVMDTLAALAFGGEPALSRYMQEKPKSRKEPIISKYMWSEIITGSAWALILSMAFLLFSPIQSVFIKDVPLSQQEININETYRSDIPTFYVPSPEHDAEIVNADGTVSTRFDALFSGYFALFIFIAVFNAFNARTEKANLFDNIGRNSGFLKILGLITVVQIGMIYLGGKVMNCVPLTLTQWCVILGMAISIIPVDLIRKGIVSVKNKSSKA
ncbi:MAG: calcium-translocating P-type ATPase, PMCA-type [Oscillospiraceae bacterium]|nr:calcium-translocating P-type ATPase, PMCA-type [Oscillospiraceae bacterium]